MSVSVGSAVMTLIQILQSSPDVAGISGNRIYPGIAPQEAGYPLLTVDIISNLPSRDKDGPSAVDDVRIQVDCYGKLYREAADLDIGVRNALDRFHGIVKGICVDGIEYIGQNPTGFDDSADYYRFSSDYKIRIGR